VVHDMTTHVGEDTVFRFLVIIIIVVLVVVVDVVRILS
jgi:hypothetical protein